MKNLSGYERNRLIIYEYIRDEERREIKRRNVTVHVSNLESGISDTSPIRITIWRQCVMDDFEPYTYIGTYSARRTAI